MDTDSENKKGSTSISCLEIIVAVLIGAVIGGAIGGSIRVRYQEDEGILWYSLGTPPSPAEKIIASSFSSIEVQAADGQIYKFEDERPPFNGSPISGNWSMVNSATPQTGDENCRSDARYISPPPLPVIDTSNGDVCYEIVFDVHYAILEDGSVWRWSTPDSYFNFSQDITGVSIGSLIGFLALGIFKWITNFIKQKKSV